MRLRTTTIPRLCGLTAIALSLSLAGAFDVPTAAASENGECAAKRGRKKSKAKKRRARRRRARKAATRRARKVTTGRILKWWKAGHSPKAIVLRADKAGWKPTAKAIRRLRRKNVSGDLIERLENLGPARVAASKARGPKRIKLEMLDSPEDIDFDSVPEPEGMPGRARPAKRSAYEPDRSVRPSQPFEEDGAKKKQSGAQPKRSRRVVVAAD